MTYAEIGWGIGQFTRDFLLISFLIYGLINLWRNHQRNKEEAQSAKWKLREYQTLLSECPNCKERFDKQNTNGVANDHT